jgi:hypothetical protein
VTALPAATQGKEPTSCEICHGSADWFEEAHLEILAGHRDGVHREIGISCHDCHGGNPDPAVADDPMAAMDDGFEPSPYRGVPERTEIPTFCGGCHSDPGYMKRFRPDARVDQEREYWTSRHGQLLREGDIRVAVCTDCHGVHGIRGAGDPESGVYPTQVAETCRACHADAELMAAYPTASGEPLPVDQYAKWRHSVHARSLLERGDLFAPTCNDCHGNHGAAPPGLDSINFVCGQCHGREASLFRDSPKRAGQELHNEMNLVDMGEDGCAACHEAPEPQASIRHIREFTECSTCHGNHGIVRATVGLLAPLPETPCAFCHESDDLEGGDEYPERASSEESFAARKAALMEQAGSLELEGDARFDWLVDQALWVPEHGIEGSVDDQGRQVLRPEFERLFKKYRIGKTYFTYEDPASAEEVRQELVRCTDCHAREPMLAAEATGYETASSFVRKMRELTVLSARADRLLLAGRRGGVEVGEADLELDRAVDAQIELEVLVHSFQAGEASAFAGKLEEGLEHARTAYLAGLGAIDELAYRRKGLVVSLGIILLVLVGLGLKIRQL